MPHPLRIRIWILIFLSAAMIMIPSPIHSNGTLGAITVSVSSLNVREGPGLNHKIIATIRQNETYPILLLQDNWVQIPLESGKKGWVASWLVDVQQPGPDAAHDVTPVADYVNVRSGPSTSFPVIDQINRGEKHRKLEANGDWIKIKVKNGTEGWVANWLVKESSKNGPSPEQEAARKPIGIKQAVIAVPVLNMRLGPDTQSGLLGQFPSGTVMDIMEQQGDWLKVKANGKTGWVANWLVTIREGGPTMSAEKPSVAEAYVKILNPGTNIRSGPGTSHEVVEIAAQGTTYPVMKAAGDWFQIRLPNGRSGYVAGWIVSANGVANVDRKGIQSVLKGKTILIDPGHGGNDSGAIGPHLGSLEKVINLDVSKLLSSKLNAAGANVLLTREDDRKVSLQERVNMSINKQVDAFISIHHNTSENYGINGIITYFYSNGEDRELAGIIQKEVVKRTGLFDLKARYGDYFVLRENPQLAVLCELGFLSNYQEEVILNTKEYQEQAAEGVFQGILKYFRENKVS